MGRGKKPAQPHFGVSAFLGQFRECLQTLEKAGWKLSPSMKEISCQVELKINRCQRFRPFDFLLCLLTIARSCFPIFGGQQKNVFNNFSRSNCRTSAGLFRSCFRSGRVLVATKESQPGDSSRDRTSSPILGGHVFTI